MSEKDFLKNLLDEMVVDGLFTEDESSELLEMLVQECQEKSHMKINMDTMHTK